MVKHTLVRDRREILQLSKWDRLILNENMYLITPVTATILNQIQRNHKMQPISAEPQCIMILGPTGAGKSTLLKVFARQFPTEYLDTIRRPILEVVVPAKATLMNFLAAILQAFEDPLADKGSIGNKTHRIYKFVDDCEVVHIMVDEPNHFIDRDSQKIIQDSSNFLKNLIKSKRLTCTVAGIKESEQVLKANSQLGRLFGDPYILPDYEWDETKRKTTVEIFCTLLYELDELLPLPASSRLASGLRPWRCFVACGGRLGYLMALLRRATEYAIERDKDCLDDMLLAEAFDNRLAGDRRGVPNPFVGEKPHESPKIVDEQNIPATNKRSKRRKKDNEDLGDVFRD